MDLFHLQSKFTLLQSNFFPPNLSFEFGILAGKNLLSKEG
jgi:hypothetical protein